MLLFLFLLVIGFCALIYGANILVDGASSVAKRLRVSDMMIGLTIVAFGTSAPELVVNIFSSLEDNSDIALGNIVGSNILNILGILGLSALIRPLTVDKATTWIQVPLTVLSAIALFLLLSDSCMDGATANVISRVDGCILLLFFAIFMGYVIQTSLSNRVSASEDDYKQMSWWKSILFVIGGLLLLVVGAKVIVDSAVKLAQMWGISQRVIGLTIISIGTSLPELATSVVAAKKNKVDIAIANIVGSNIFNAFFILGVSAIICPVHGTPSSIIDLLVNVFVSLLLFAFIFTGKGRRLDRWEGALFIASYIIYTVWLIVA
jgi:cation:H+ antiporter